MKRDLRALADQEHDLLVVGGGIYGAAAALDGAQRGLRVALVEAEDFGSGVSWNSLKTIHGGLRYMQKADLRRMRESITERRALLRIAPDLVEPLRFLIPTTGHGTKSREAMAAAFLVNELVSADRNRGLGPKGRIPRARTLCRADTLAMVPGLDAGSLSGGALWTDAQARSTERLIIGFARAAAERGAGLANHVEASSLLRSGERVIGVRAIDRETREAFDVRARMTLNCAGPGALSLLDRSGVAHPDQPFLRAINLVFRSRPRVDLAVGCRTQSRLLFLVPWNGQTMVGTEYTPAEVPFGSEEVRAFLARAQRAFPWAGLEQRDLCLVHNGLVPGEGSAKGLSTRPLLLDHARWGVPGLVSLVGVKYTTGRLVAERAVDLCLRRLGSPVERCRTDQAPLPHARVLEGPLDERARTAVRDEMARSLSDAVLRRLDLGTGGPASEADLAVVLRVLCAELCWSGERQAAEREALAATYRTID